MQALRTLSTRSHLSSWGVGSSILLFHLYVHQLGNTSSCVIVRGEIRSELGGKCLCLANHLSVPQGWPLLGLGVVGTRRWTVCGFPRAHCSVSRKKLSVVLMPLQGHAHCLSWLAEGLFLRFSSSTRLTGPQIAVFLTQQCSLPFGHVTTSALCIKGMSPR